MDEKVWSKYGTALRFGTVTEEKIENGWKFVSVDWVNDKAYDKAIAWLSKLRPDEDHTKKWYRIDEVNQFQPGEMIEALKKL
jgi:hypothetical protein